LEDRRIIHGVGGCCDPGGYDDLFSVRFSRHLARRYRKRGLDRTATKILAFLTAQGIDGATVLEIGGGVGVLQLELLRRGAARATNLEIVDSYEQDAAALADEAGFASRITRRHVDLATAPSEVEAHDIVVLHRVVCCYRDYERLLTAASDHATRLLVYSYPPRNFLSRTMFATENFLFRLRRSAFRAYIHDPGAMAAAAQRGHLHPTYRRGGMTWHILGLTAD